MKIGMTSIYVRDPVRAFAFYTEVLGFARKLFMPEASLAIVVSPHDKGGTSLLLEPTENPIGRTYQEAMFKNGIPAIVFTTDDVAEEVKKLLAAGVNVISGPNQTEYGIEALFEDGFGNIIQLYQD